MRSCLPASEGSHRGCYSWVWVHKAWVRVGKNSEHVVSLCCPLATYKLLSTLELGMERKKWWTRKLGADMWGRAPLAAWWPCRHTKFMCCRCVFMVKPEAESFWLEQAFLGWVALATLQEHVSSCYLVHRTLSLFANNPSTFRMALSEHVLDSDSSLSVEDAVLMNDAPF